MWLNMSKWVPFVVALIWVWWHEKIWIGYFTPVLQQETRCIITVLNIYDQTGVNLDEKHTIRWMDATISEASGCKSINLEKQNKKRKFWQQFSPPMKLPETKQKR
jgi:hypothetical protein